MSDGAKIDRRAELLAELSRSRTQMASSFSGLRVDLDLPAHFKVAVGRNKSIWLGCAALFGWLMAKLPARKKTVYLQKGHKTEIKNVEKAGLLLGLFKLVFSLLRPLIMGFATKRIAEITQGKENVERPRRNA